MYSLYCLYSQIRIKSSKRKSESVSSFILKPFVMSSLRQLLSNSQFQPSFCSLMISSLCDNCNHWHNTSLKLFPSLSFLSHKTRANANTCSLTLMVTHTLALPLSHFLPLSLCLALTPQPNLFLDYKVNNGKFVLFHFLNVFFFSRNSGFFSQL